MNIYLCTLERSVIIEYIGGWPRYELRCEDELIVAPSRGKARAIFADSVNEEFTYPMSIKKVTHSIPQDELKIGVMCEEEEMIREENQRYRDELYDHMYRTT